MGSAPLTWLGPSWGPQLPAHPQEQVVSTSTSSFIIAFGLRVTLSGSSSGAICPPGHRPPDAGLTEQQGNLDRRSDLEGGSPVWAPIFRGTLMTWTCEPGAGMGGTGSLGAGAASQDCPLSTWGTH